MIGLFLVKISGRDIRVVLYNLNFNCVLLFISGKGPLKSYYEGIIAKKNFVKVIIRTMWLASEDYPLILGTAHKWHVQNNCILPTINSAHVHSLIS